MPPLRQRPQRPPDPIRRGYGLSGIGVSLGNGHHRHAPPARSSATAAGHKLKLDRDWPCPTASPPPSRACGRSPLAADATATQATAARTPPARTRLSLAYATTTARRRATAHSTTKPPAAPLVPTDPRLTTPLPIAVALQHDTGGSRLGSPPTMIGGPTPGDDMRRGTCGRGARVDSRMMALAHTTIIEGRNGWSRGSLRASGCGVLRRSCRTGARASRPHTPAQRRSGLPRSAASMSTVRPSPGETAMPARRSSAPAKAAISDAGA